MELKLDIFIAIHYVRICVKLENLILICKGNKTVLVPLYTPFYGYRTVDLEQVFVRYRAAFTTGEKLDENSLSISKT